jgi:hypothetical protein
MTDIAALAAPFPADAIHWRAQTLKADGTSAMALAYIDARHVMRRLDEVCGPENWQDSYTETVKGRLICTLQIRIGGEWISKSDGAGDTDVEGDKGAISDALKRAAVKWGIGRYLYDMPVTWADCESYDKNGKKHWKKWTPAGLAKLARVQVPASSVPATQPPVIDDAQWAELTGLIAATQSDSVAMCEHYRIPSLKQMTVPQFEDATARLRKRIPQPEQKAA